MEPGFLLALSCTVLFVISNNNPHLLPLPNKLFLKLKASICFACAKILLYTHVLSVDYTSINNTIESGTSNALGKQVLVLH